MGMPGNVFTRVMIWGALGASLLVSPVAAQQARRTDAARAPADEGVAKGLFQAGKAAYEAGRYEEALSFFEQAYTQSERPRMLYNIGQTADRLRRDERALEAFRKFLELVPDDPLRVEVEKRVAALEQAVAARDAARAAAPTAEPEQASASAAPSVQASEPSALDQAIALPPEDREPDGGGVLSQWWFWTAAAVLVGGGVTALVLVLGDDEPVPQRPIAGEVGGVVTTLGRFE
jgi:tetratricopeptide (TPR) repeat protein